MDKIFFQSSLPRSGSTLLQNILGQNPDFYVTPTSGILELMYAARRNYTESPEFKAQDPELMKKAFLGFCNGGLTSYFNSITDKKYVIDKSRGWGVHYNFLNSVYPDPKIVCMVRDLRDVFASMEKNFRKNQHKDSLIVNHATMEGTTTEKRIDVWANSQPVGLAIERLYQMFNEGIGNKILFIRFEDLTREPQTEMDKIYEFFGIPTYYHNFDDVQQITKEDDTVYGIYGDHTIKQKVEFVESSAQQVLGAPICDWIKNRWKWFYEIFKYE